jgi:hypothetical protein
MATFNALINRAGDLTWKKRLGGFRSAAFHQIAHRPHLL